MNQTVVSFAAFSRAARSRLIFSRSFNQVTSLATFSSLARCLRLFKCDQSSPTPTLIPNAGFSGLGSGGGEGRALALHSQTSVVAGSKFPLAFRADLLIVAKRCWISSSERVRTVWNFSTSLIVSRICGSTTALRYLKQAWTTETSAPKQVTDRARGVYSSYALDGTNGIFGMRRARRWSMHHTTFVRQFLRLLSRSTGNDRWRMRVVSFRLASNGLVVNLFRCQRRRAIPQNCTNESHRRPFGRYLPDIECHERNELVV